MVVNHSVISIIVVNSLFEDIFSDEITALFFPIPCWGPPIYNL